ncbi:Dhx36 [Symbiodinium sp. CCMP2592]|nr:Dhx36 [Symbiodinium sp. CCMP2592]
MDAHKKYRCKNFISHAEYMAKKLVVEQMFHNFAVGDIIKDVEQAEAACAAGLEMTSREIVFRLLAARGHSRFTKEKFCRGITLGMVWFRGPRIVLGPEAAEHVLDILQGPRLEAGCG